MLISDEAHHINTLTKKKLSKGEKENFTSWEYTVRRILDSSPENIMMEFTATLELNHPNIASKYANKLLYDYSLAKFREDGYSKEVQTNQVDYQPIQRAIVAILISQFKKKIFASKGILAKPVVMFKSKTTIETAAMACMLHDIGKAIDASAEGSHAVVGADFIKKYGKARHDY